MESLLCRLGDRLSVITCYLYGTAINEVLCNALQVLYATPNQDGFYDITDALEEQGMEQIIKVRSQVSQLIYHTAAFHSVAFNLLRTCSNTHT